MDRPPPADLIHFNQDFEVWSFETIVDKRLCKVGILPVILEQTLNDRNI